MLNRRNFAAQLRGQAGLERSQQQPLRHGLRNRRPGGELRREFGYAWSPDGGHLAVARRVGRARRLAFVRLPDGQEVAAVASDSELVRWLPAP